MKRKSTEEFECFPYICTLLNSCLWTYYGITRPGSYLVATVNGFGTVVEIIYVSLFLAYAPPRTRVNKLTRHLSCLSVSHAGLFYCIVQYCPLVIIDGSLFQVKTATLVGILDVGFLVTAILVTHFAMHGDTRIDAIGFMCAALNIVMYGSPLASMVRLPLFLAHHTL